jgi:GT2 family glycosyltransferase
MAQSNEEILIAVLSFNHPEITKKTVLSALEFATPENVMLTHNGSDEKNILDLKTTFPLIQHLVVEKNSGYTKGANITLQTGFKTHNWVLFLTNDCVLKSRPEKPKTSGFWAPCIYRRKIAHVDSLGGTLNLLTGQLRHLRTPTEATRILNASKIKKQTYLSPQFYIPGTAFYLDKDSFHRIGVFDESLHTYWEDVDYSLRATKLNVPMGLCENTKIIHAVGKTCHKKPMYTQYLFHRNRSKICKRYGPKILNRYWEYKIAKIEKQKGNLWV